MLHFANDHPDKKSRRDLERIRTYWQSCNRILDARHRQEKRLLSLELESAGNCQVELISPEYYCSQNLSVLDRAGTLSFGIRSHLRF